MSVATRPEAQNLEAARARLQRLGGPMLEALAASGQALAVSDAADPERPIVFANRAFEALTGYAEGEILGSSWAVLEAPGAVQDIEAAGAATCDRPCRRRDGSIFWGRISLSVLRDEDGAPLFHLATLADVSAEHVPAADLLQITRRRLVQAQEQLHAARVAAGAAGAWEWDIPAARLTGDARFANLQGLDPVETAAGLPTNAFFRSVHPDDRLRLRIAVAGALNGAEVFARDFRLLVDGEERWVSARGRTYLDGEDRPLRFSGVLADITDQKRLEERLKIAQSAGGIGAFEYVVGFGTVEVFGQFCELLGLRPATSLPVRTINGLVVPGDPAIIQEAEESQPIGASYQEFRIRRADTGEERWLQSHGSRIDDPDGSPGRFVGISFDVTDARESQRRQQLLIDELDHRVKNTLAIIQGIAQQTFKAEVDPAVARDAFEGRLRALSTTHNVLTAKHWGDVSLAKLVRDALAPHGSAAAIAIDGPDLSIAPRTAVSLSLGLHELATNAVKYGALSTPDGRVSVRWSIADPAAPRLHLEWRESGGPDVHAPERRGFGTRMIERGLTAELGGEVRIDFAPDGLVCMIDAPLPGRALA